MLILKRWASNRRPAAAVALLLLTAAAAAAGCQPAADLSSTATGPGPVIVRLATVTAVPTVALPLSATPAPTVTATATVTAARTPALTATPSPTWTVTASPTTTATLVPTSTPTLPRIDHYRLRRPIARRDDLVDYVDRTYPYGSTQMGAREVHTGVEFFNRRFTPVLAAATGRVIFAGEDSSTRLGPVNDYYGNVILLQHDFLSPDGLPVFTLYGHLERVDVAAGQRVEEGQPIGQVGDSGIAIGPHLHFEVRVGDGYDFYSTRNPDLWLRPYPGFGTLAGRVTRGGILQPGVLILVRSSARTRETYTYGPERVNSDPVWQENFTLGDLPAGSYEVILGENGRIRFQATLTIRDGQTAFVDIALE
ncbi:MAG: M23 family metallopeptidase [Anaerolineae bacterium]|nr:M23 family metallopeptidase [Anaerolineae bacterium]